MPLKWGHLFTDPLFNSWDFLKCSFMRIVSVVQSLHCSRTYFPLTWSSMSHWILYCFSSLFNCWIYFVNSHPFAYFMWLKPSLCVVYLSLNVVAVHPIYSFVMSSEVTFALYTMLLFKHWLLIGHSSFLLQLHSLSCSVLLSSSSVFIIRDLLWVLIFAEMFFVQQ